MPMSVDGVVSRATTLAVESSFFPLAYVRGAPLRGLLLH